jgi:phosphatidylglycerophosphatase C
MKLILFDFDGTLTTKDSFISFIRFATTKTQFNAGLRKFFFKLFLYKVRVYNGEKIKKEILSYFFKAFSKDKLDELGSVYSQKIIPSLINKEIMNQLFKYQNEGHKIGVVSASLDIWLKPFCDELNIDCLCTEMEFIESKYTGNFKTPNCNFKQKEVRVKAFYNLAEYSEVIAYGNSKGDKYLFELADKKIKV